MSARSGGFSAGGQGVEPTREYSLDQIIRVTDEDNPKTARRKSLAELVFQ